MYLLGLSLGFVLEPQPSTEQRSGLRPGQYLSMRLAGEVFLDQVTITVTDLEQAFLAGGKVHVVDDVFLTLIFSLFMHVEGWLLRVHRRRRD
jgi:hypothetical protein